MSKINQKKILDTSPMSGIAVPLAIVLVGALIIWGVTQMLSSGKNHRDLVEELHSKTFGNRWVAAYELSKYIVSSSIPEKDIPWVVENLGNVYKSSPNDPKTRNFVVMAMGGLGSSLAGKYLLSAVSDSDAEVSFNALVGLGKITGDFSSLDWSEVLKKTESQDSGLVQVALMAMDTHNHKEVIRYGRSGLKHQSPVVRYVASQILLSRGESGFEGIVQEMINLKKSERFNSAEVEGIKLNLVKSLGKKLNQKNISYLKLLKLDKNVKISTKAAHYLNL